MPWTGPIDSQFFPQWRGLLLERNAQVESGTRESEKSTGIQGRHSNTSSWMSTLFHPQTIQLRDWEDKLTTPMGHTTFKKFRISSCLLGKLKGWSIGPLLIKGLPLSTFSPGHWYFISSIFIVTDISYFICYSFAEGWNALSCNK